MSNAPGDRLAYSAKNLMNNIWDVRQRDGILGERRCAAEAWTYQTPRGGPGCRQGHWAKRVAGGLWGETLRNAQH